ncbi:MAG: hypothetical protein FD147_2615 [Chloroflexi bacterium]|nr:MAG: hypothetical protein FD147_2615 [Chloroflexota bacterium]MBA4376758.1 hypothetical protein [Anaerolinea sp.]
MSSDLILSIPVIVVTVILVGLIFWLSHKKKVEREQKIRTLASQYGWTYEPVAERLVSGYRLRKSEWVLEALNTTTSHSGDATGSSDVTQMTRWWSAAAKMKEGIVLIGPRQSDINLSGIGDFLIQAALRLMIGSEADFAKDIKQIEMGKLSFNKRYMVWTNQEEAANRLLEMAVENALINWPTKLPPIVKFSPVGMEVKLQTQRLDKPEEIVALVKLGETLLAAAT